MSSPVSGLFGEIKLRSLETRISTDLHLKPTVLYGFVDDIFIL